MHNLLPEELAETLVFEKTSLTGHYGNPITLLTAELSDKKMLPAVLQKIGSGLNSLDKEELSRDLKLHMEKRNLYLRFDKQSAYLGTIKFLKTTPFTSKYTSKTKLLMK